ncbi:TPA: hypothetical protein ACHTOV_004742 [Enterobacter cancerogenus]|uniref:hypothetical protein n=1 Tax=Enterobacter cancerogenus TaxID=69218 RepID=UPI001299EA58|nr:hypothetical protein [Enterobacter cancerogenus]EKS7428441.1 hypothetical protein [Enterobacter cancerogenus]EKS7429774.1 hypothetical protein [Enterobacter cancerogenus]MRG32686.1 hypothetical protein [Enterobacter cancerogenus]QGG09749.1 hypothetical protein GH771_13735 [Enterobacter cancerogenus]QZY37474.1 hypothetical protein HU826_02920 [Enterobacter cancerogenus]
MKTKSSFWTNNLFFLILAILLCITGCSIVRYTSLNTAWLFLLAGLSIGFLSILESTRLDRRMKGISLIFVGIFLSIGIPDLFNHSYADIMTDDFRNSMEIFKNLAILACAGAGGGILANHAENIPAVDVLPSDKDEHSALVLKHILGLKTDVTKQRNRLNEIRFLLGLITFMLAGVLVVLILK